MGMMPEVKYASSTLMLLAFKAEVDAVQACSNDRVANRHSSLVMLVID